VLRTRTLAFATAVVLSGLSISVADACSCIVPSRAETFDRAILVFRGRLVDAAPHPSDPCADETLTFLPSKIWKGKSTGPVTVTSASVGRRRDGSLPASDERSCRPVCPVFVRQGKEYVVFLFEKPFKLGFCHAPVEVGSEKVSALQSELDALARRHPPSRRRRVAPSRLQGSRDTLE
jgi:hypothetical protein